MSCCSWHHLSQVCRWTCMHACVHACLCSCVPVFMRACVHACLCSCVPVFMRACVHACLCSCVPVFMHACVHACLCSCMPVFMHVNIRAHLHACLPIYVCAFRLVRCSAVSIWVHFVQISRGMQPLLCQQAGRLYHRTECAAWNHAYLWYALPCALGLSTSELLGQKTEGTGSLATSSELFASSESFAMDDWKPNDGERYLNFLKMAVSVNGRWIRNMLTFILLLMGSVDWVEYGGISWTDQILSFIHTPSKLGGVKTLMCPVPPIES